MQKIRKAVITAAGKGTRQYPATNSVQKELFPLVDVDGYTKPALQIIVEEALASGIEEICIVTNPSNAAAIKSHFKGLSPAQRDAFANKPWGLALSANLSDIEKRLTFVVQERQEGYGHAVYQAKDFVGSDPFLMLLGDHIYVTSANRCAKQVVDQYSIFEAPISSVSAVAEQYVSRYGIVKADPISGSDVASKIVRMVEKPTLEVARREFTSERAPVGTFFSFFGIHALPCDIFGHLSFLIKNDIRVKNEIQFTSAQELLLLDSPLYIALSIDGTRYDIGVPDGLVETQVALALYSPFAKNLYATVAEVERQKRGPTGVSQR